VNGTAFDLGVDEVDELGHQADRGLVQEQGPGSGHGQAGDLEHPLLAARERARRLPPALLQLGKTGVDLLERAPERRLVALEDPAAELEVFLDRHARKDAVALEQIRDALAQHRLGREPSDRSAIVQDVALARLQIAVDGAQERRLAGAVRADDHGHEAVLGDHVNVLEDRHLAGVAGDDAARLEAHGLMPPTTTAGALCS
jgi:hypothetical protein